MIKQKNVLFRVPNNPEGRLFLEIAKKYINNDSYQLKLRGRTPNSKLKNKDKCNYRYGIPLKYADNVAVYLQTKGGTTIGINRINREKNYSESMELVRTKLINLIKEL